MDMENEGTERREEKKFEDSYNLTGGSSREQEVLKTRVEPKTIHPPQARIQAEGKSLH